MPQFDGQEPNLRHRCLFGCVLGRFRNVGSLGARIFSRACKKKKKKILTLWWGIPQFDGCEPNLRQWCVFLSRSRAVPKCWLLRSWNFSRTCEKNISWRCGEKCPNSKNISCVVPKCRLSESLDFSRSCEKIISSHGGGECPNLIVGNRICDTGAFRSRSGAGLKCQVPRSRDFLRACEKNISWHCGGECPNSMVGNLICVTGVFSIAFWGCSKMSFLKS